MDIYNQILDENELKYHKINDEIFKEVLIKIILLHCSVIMFLSVY